MIIKYSHYNVFETHYFTIFSYLLYSLDCALYSSDDMTKNIIFH